MEFGKFGGKTKVVYSVPFRPEQTENLVPVCKPVRGNPPFHLRLNFEVFRVISGVSDHFGQFTFWRIFFFSLFSTSLISSPRTAVSQATSPHSSSQPATPASRLQPSAPHSSGPAYLSALSSLPPHSSKAADCSRSFISDQLIKKNY
jgi:hypothetical protein